MKQDPENIQEIVKKAKDNKGITSKEFRTYLNYVEKEKIRK